MTEDEARRVLLLQSRESDRASSVWTLEDRAWASRQAADLVGEKSTPERFVVARAGIGLQRLLPRDRAAERWLARRAWHPAWVLLALVLGFAAGVVADELGPPQRVNLLAPAVWLVLFWNVFVYLALVLPLPTASLRQALAGWRQRGGSALATLWARYSAPLTTQRVTLLLHVASAALALGLIAGLYLQGLVRDYRAGWQSTFLDTAAVQLFLNTFLAPASALTGVAVPDVAPLRVGPDGLATASAAPWIHLYAASLALLVVLPRGLLALLALWRSRRMSRRFPLALDTPYFEGLHPLMQPSVPRAVRLIWAGGGQAVCLFGTQVGSLENPLPLLRSDEGDELHLLPLPAWLQPSLPGLPGPSGPAPLGKFSTLGSSGTPGSRWLRWLGGPDPLQAELSALRESVSAVLLVAAPGAPRPEWLATLGRPVVVLADGVATAAVAPADAPADAPAHRQAEWPAEARSDGRAGASPLSLRRLADGWLPDGRLLSALESALEGDPRMRRLRESWTARQRVRFEAGVTELATSLARMACMREPVADERFLARRGEADAARAALAKSLDEEWGEGIRRLKVALGDSTSNEPEASLAASAALRHRVGEGRAALMGGVISGALSGLTADLLSGGVTLGAGLVAGGVIGALGAAGVARGLNVVRGTDRSFAIWDERALNQLTEELLLRSMQLLAPWLAPEAARKQLTPALAAQGVDISALWRARLRRFDNAGEADRLARELRPLLSQTLHAALGGPA